MDGSESKGEKVVEITPDVVVEVNDIGGGEVAAVLQLPQEGLPSFDEEKKVPELPRLSEEALNRWGNLENMGMGDEQEEDDEDWWHDEEADEEENEMEEEDYEVRNMTQLDMLMSWKSMKAEVKTLRCRIHRRSCMIEQLRRSYIKDVVAMKLVLKNLPKIRMPEFQELIVLWESALPSVDLTAPLALHGPALSFVSVSPCKQCGGTIDISRYDGKQVEELTIQLASLEGRMKKLRLQLATEQSNQADARVEALNERKHHSVEVHSCWRMLHILV